MTKIYKTITEIIAEGGATLNAEGRAVNYATGYQVSRRDMFTIAAARLRWSHIKPLLAKGAFVGVWVENGIAYVDMSERVNTKAEALRLGRERNQISVWNWSKKTCVYC